VCRNECANHLHHVTNLYQHRLWCERCGEAKPTSWLPSTTIVPEFFIVETNDIYRIVYWIAFGTVSVSERHAWVLLIVHSARERESGKMHGSPKLATSAGQRHISCMHG
jgi:hypothetical protein